MPVQGEHLCHQAVGDPPQYRPIATEHVDGGTEKQLAAKFHFGLTVPAGVGKGSEGEPEGP